VRVEENGKGGGGEEFDSRAEMKDERMGGGEAGRGRAREREEQSDETAQIDIERGGMKRK